LHTVMWIMCKYPRSCLF